MIYVIDLNNDLLLGVQVFDQLSHQYRLRVTKWLDRIFWSQDHNWLDMLNVGILQMTDVQCTTLKEEDVDVLAHELAKGVLHFIWLWHYAYRDIWDSSRLLNEEFDSLRVTSTYKDVIAYLILSDAYCVYVYDVIFDVDIAFEIVYFS